MEEHIENYKEANWYTNDIIWLKRFVRINKTQLTSTIKTDCSKNEE